MYEDVHTSECGLQAFYSNHKSSDFPEFSQSLKCQSKSTGSGIYYNFTVADPDLELTGWGGGGGS